MDIQDRFIRGVVEHITPDMVQFELEENIFGAKKGRLKPDDFHQDFSIKNYKIKEEHVLFILQQSNYVQGLYFVSGKLADQSKNPILNGDIELRNTVVTGEVIAFANDKEVVVRLNEYPLSARLTLDKIPQKTSQPVEKVFQIGDRIKAIVDKIDDSDWEIRLDVGSCQQYISDDQSIYENEWKANGWEKVTEATEEEIENEIDDYREISIDLGGKSVIVVDDQPIHQLKEYLESLNAEVIEYKGSEYDDILLNGNSITHGILDYSLGQKWNFNDLFKKFKNVGFPLLIYSGNASAKKFAESNSLPCLIRPDLEGLAVWLDSGKVVLQKSIEKEAISSTEVDAGVHQIIEEKGNVLLREICLEAGFIGAFWVLSEQENIYEFRSHFYVIAGAMHEVEKHLKNSVVKTVLSSGKESIEKLHQYNPLTPICPTGSQYVWGDVIAFPGDGHKRGVFFLCGSPPSDEAKFSFRKRLPLFRETIARLKLIRYIERIEPFANFGKIQGGVIHEIRTRAQYFNLQANSLKRKMEKAVDLASIKSDYKRLTYGFNKISTLCSNGLFSLMSKTAVSIVPAKLIQRILRYYAEEYPQISFFSNARKFDDIHILFNSDVLEQAMINLLENAVFHLGEGMNGFIKISLATKDEELPKLLIHIEDNGPGMSKNQINRLFISRSSSKTVGGVGMGLFITKVMLQRQNANIELGWTYKWMGSCFIITLPLNIAKQEDT